jgi:hypothetical protein
MRNALVSRLCPFVFAAAVSAQGAGFEPPALQTVLNSTSIDTEPCLSFDGLTLWFYSNRTGGVGGLDIYSTTRSYIGGPWSAPVCETSLSSSSSEYSPFISLGDTEIHFCSNRAGTVGSLDVWRATRAAPGQPWSTPVNVTELNSTGGELQFSMTLDGTECYFLTTGWGNPGGANNSIYRSTRAGMGLPWSAPTIVAELYNGKTHRDVEISSDGLQLIYTEFQPSPISRLYVYAATRPDRNSPFGTPVNWSELNNVGTLQGVNSITLSQQGDEAILGVGFPSASGNQELMRTRRSVAYGQGCGGAAALALAGNAPNVGGNWDLVTANVDAVSPAAFTFFGSSPTALPLDGIGAPGCGSFVDLPFLSLSAAPVAGVATLSIPVPAAPALIGQVFFSQSACLTAGNLLGIFASNGLKSVLGG